MRNTGELRTLGVNFQEIDSRDLGNIIEPVCLDRHLSGHHSENRIKVEAVKNGRIGSEQAAHARSVTYFQGRRRSIAHGIGQVGFKIALAFIQRSETFELWFETDKGTDALTKHRLVRRHIGNWIGADIDDGGQAFRLQELD